MIVVNIFILGLKSTLKTLYVWNQLSFLAFQLDGGNTIWDGTSRCDFCATLQFRNKHCWSFKRTKTLVCFHVPPLSQTVGNECISSSLQVVLRLWEQMSFWWNLCFVTRCSDVSTVPTTARDTRVPRHLECKSLIIRNLNSRCRWLVESTSAGKSQNSLKKFTVGSHLFPLKQSV